MTPCSLTRSNLVAISISFMIPVAVAQCTPQWIASNLTISDSIRALTQWDSDGTGPLPPRLVVGGYLATVAGLPAGNVALHDPQANTWATLGTGVAGSLLGPGLTRIEDALAAADGSLYVCGNFLTAGGVSASCCARWDGTAWSSLGAGFNNLVRALVQMPNGDIVAAGDFVTPAFYKVARWNGSSWTSMGFSVAYGNALSLAVDTNGNLIVGADTGVYRQNGSTWSLFGASQLVGSPSHVYALQRMPNGDIVAGGSFLNINGITANRIARWNGSAWSTFGGCNSDVMALTLVPNGDLIVGGFFSQAGGLPASRVARWNGATWSPLGSGVSSQVYALAYANGGVVAVGGDFSSAGGFSSYRFAKYSSTCVATQASGGAGCGGSAGSNVLGVVTEAWTGANFVARATGLPSSGNVLAVGVYGFTPAALPLASIVPQGLPGCMLHVVDEILLPLTPVAGAVNTSIAIPGSVSIAGQTFHHQVLPIELDATNTITAVGATNSLVVTVGTL